MLHSLDKVRIELQAAEHGLDSIQTIAAGINRISESIAASESAAMTAGNVAEFSANGEMEMDDMYQNLVDLLTKMAR